jgi:hypothetical protein
LEGQSLRIVAAAIDLHFADFATTSAGGTAKEGEDVVCSVSCCMDKKGEGKRTPQ